MKFAAVFYFYDPDDLIIKLKRHTLERQANFQGQIWLGVKIAFGC